MLLRALKPNIRTGSHNLAPLSARAQGARVSPGARAQGAKCVKRARCREGQPALNKPIPLTPFSGTFSGHFFRYFFRYFFRPLFSVPFQATFSGHFSSFLFFRATHPRSPTTIGLVGLLYDPMPHNLLNRSPTAIGVTGCSTTPCLTTCSRIRARRREGPRARLGEIRA